ncbi:MAG: TetR/AcrR family transcriptional regulator [Gordonia sp. (in: high G+C Gram-positive bacteria)]|uniref:TetR/AcrR family transcriptional regulator n=1 Tax=Gordonia sp. (in: high G+C Gram-positive bacteria) TaxID=84139 RepID=UPI0039E71727
MAAATDSVDTRERLIRAGVELIDEDSGDLGLRAIARRAGVSHGAPRRYFPTHRSLLAAIAALGLSDLAVAVRRPLHDRGLPAGDRLVEASVVYVDFASRRRAMFALMFRHDLLDGAGANLRATTLPLLSDLHEVVAEFRQEPSRPATISLWTAVHGIAVLSGNRALELLGDDAPAPRDLVVAAVDAALRR